MADLFDGVPGSLIEGSADAGPTRLAVGAAAVADLAADTVAIPRVVLRMLYREWLRHHSCYSGECGCDRTITVVEGALQSDGFGRASEG